MEVGEHLHRSIILCLYVNIVISIWQFASIVPAYREG